MRNLIFLFIILGFLMTEGCYHESDFSPQNVANADTGLQVSLQPAAIPADSFSTARIVIELPYNADTTKASATIRTDLGIFLESGTNSVIVTAKSNIDSSKKIAIATLRGGTVPGTAHLGVYFYSSTQFPTVQLYNAYPRSMIMSASTLNVKPANDATGEVSFTCKLFRDSGSVSQRNIVNMQVVDSNSQPLGQFRVYNDLSDNTGSTQFTFVLCDSLVNGINYYGRMLAISSTAIDSLGHLKYDSLYLYSTH
jgi:hypothetical protein